MPRVKITRTKSLPAATKRTVRTNQEDISLPMTNLLPPSEAPALIYPSERITCNHFNSSTPELVHHAAMLRTVNPTRIDRRDLLILRCLPLVRLRSEEPSDQADHSGITGRQFSLAASNAPEPLPAAEIVFH